MINPMKIVAIETIVPGEHSQLPALVFVRIHTDDGLVGCGETYYTPRAVSAYIHEFLAPLIIGTDAIAPEAIWETAVPSRSEVRGQGSRTSGLVGGRHRRVGSRGAGRGDAALQGARRPGEGDDPHLQHVWRFDVRQRLAPRVRRCLGGR